MENLLMVIMRGYDGVTDQTRMYVPTCSETGPLSPGLSQTQNSPGRADQLR